MDTKILSYFVRHGSTALNDSNSFRGESDPPLDEHGSQDAEEVKEFLGGKDFGEVIGSDKLRVQQTAGIVLEKQHKLPVLTPKLRPWNVGYLTGLSKDTHGSEIDKYQENPDMVIPRGESLNQFRGRVNPVIKFAIKRGFETGLPSLVFAHSSIIHQVGHLLHGDHEAGLVKPGGVAVVKLSKEKGLHVEPLFKPETKRTGYGS